MDENKKVTETKNKPGLKVILPIAAVALVLIIFLITAVAFGTGTDIRKGVFINDIDVGGMSKEQALEAVTAVTENAVDNEKVEIVFRDDTAELAFSELVNSYNIDRAAEEAYSVARGRNVISNGISAMGLRFKPVHIKLSPEYDEELISRSVNSYAAKIDKPLIQNFYEIKDDRLRLVNGEAGFDIDKETAEADIKNILTSLKSGSVTIKEIEKSPVPFDIDAIYDETAVPPVNASLEERDGKKYLVKAKNGYDFDKKDLEKLIEENKDNEKAYYLDLEIISPEITSVSTEDLFNEVLAEYTSKITDSNRDRLTNVRLAAEKINGITINPGEEFRYLQNVEPITVAGGYKVANVYSNGRVEQDVGGGVCQVSSALYTAVLYADLEVTKRYNHSLTVAYVPLGQDATVASGEIDFRFVNNTNAPLKIQTRFSPSGITAILLGEKVDKNLKIELENVTVSTNGYETVVTEDPSLKPGEVVTDVNGKTGYVVETYKNYYRNGEFVERKYVSKSTYKTVTRQQRRGPEAAETSAEVAPEAEGTSETSETPSASATPKAAEQAPSATPVATPEAEETETE